MKGRGTKMVFEDVLKLVQAVSDSSLSSFKYEAEGVKISLKADRAPKVSLQPGIDDMTEAPPLTLAIPTKAGEAVEGTLVTSPLVGTFYTAPAEDADAFVQVGDRVKEGQTLAIVEAMKLMNEIESEAEGTIVEILVSNGEAVEYGQPLFRIA